ncbi:MAG TPA: ATP-binding protein [Ktedonobacteraceae bacterium]|nr:ATP-binding protein [Ktedonobacteraceae bacterium]
MERLNEIMGRSIHKRSQGADPRSNFQRPAGQQGSQRPAAPGQRRPVLSEQVARQGQQHPSSPAYPAQGQSRPPYVPDRQQNHQPGLPAPRTNYPTNRNGAPDTGANHYRQPTHYRETPQPYQAPASGDYYEVDAYSENPPMESDVLDQWEEEDSTMRYGDWEEVEEESPIYSRTPRNDYFPAADDITATREISIMPSAEARSPLTRLMRNQIAPPMQPASPSIQKQPTPLRNPRPYGNHRVTQPLSPETLSGLGRESMSDLPPTQRPLSRPPLSERVAERNRFASASSAPTAPPSTALAPIAPPPGPQAGVCKLCKGAGYLRADVPYGHPNFGKPIACECKEAEKAEKRRQQLRQISNMHAFREKTFSTFNSRVPGIQEAFTASQSYASDPDGWLVLIGRNGCGKTHLAAAIANQRLEKGSLVLFTTVPDLLDHLRATFAPNSEVVYDQLFSNMREAELLVLDDLGSEQSSSWASEKLFQLLNYRYNLRFPTVITTNNIRLQSVDERIRSRLMDASMVTSVTLDRAQDYRPHSPRR